MINLIGDSDILGYANVNTNHQAQNCYLFGSVAIPPTLKKSEGKVVLKLPIMVEADGFSIERMYALVIDHRSPKPT